MASKKSASRSGTKAAKAAGNVLANKKSAKKSARKSATLGKKIAVKSNGNVVRNINAWQDDPISGLEPIPRPAPKLSSPPLATAIKGIAPAASQYPPDTSDFRYWTAAETLRRASDFWGALLPAKTRWHTGASLPVTLDEGVDLNAYYDRTGLFFFHSVVTGTTTTVYSAESPDIVAHEFGHALLDAVRPELWNVMSVEVAAFHESFGDISAILVALQLREVRQAVLSEIGGKLYRSSRISRVAEQLGWAIRQSFPQAVDPDCLRNAVNQFFYRDPDTLPPNAPASALSSEPHSFSRIFTAGFLEALAGMLATRATAPVERDLQRVSTDAARLLLDAIADAPVVPDYYSQIAGHMIEADNGTYHDALVSAFVRRGILSLQAAVTVSNPGAVVPARRGIASMVPVDVDAGGVAPVPQVALAASDYGLNVQSLIVDAPGQTKRLPVTAAALAMGVITPASEEVSAKSFVEDLFRRGRVEIGSHGDKSAQMLHPFVRKTHNLKGQDEGVTLVRHTFDCGFD